MKYEELRLNLNLNPLSIIERRDGCQACSGLGHFRSLAEILIFLGHDFQRPQLLSPINMVPF
jgi:hypothetical protein